MIGIEINDLEQIEDTLSQIALKAILSTILLSS